jgi:hypothetical protein
MSLNNCKLITLPKIEDYRGNISFAENNKQAPFTIKRIYYLYDIPTAAKRGGHAHKTLQQVIIPLSGSFTIKLDDGSQKKNYLLDKPWEGLYLSPMVWREITGFTSGSICLVLASDYYDENDYYNDYHEFIKASKK